MLKDKGQDAAKRGEEIGEQYALALNLADTVWRSETDGVLNQDRLSYLRAQYVKAVFADYVDAAVAEAVKERDAEIARLRAMSDEQKIQFRLAQEKIDQLRGLLAETRREERERFAKYVSGSPPRARGDMKKGLCKWCESWERIAASGEVGTCLDPNNPNNLLATECEHPPDYWPGPMPASAPPICAGGIEPTDTWRPDRPASATEGEK